MKTYHCLNKECSIVNVVDEDGTQSTVFKSEIKSNEKFIKFVEVEVDPKLGILREISRLESAQLMPRATREFMLLSMQTWATPEQLAANPGYQSVLEFDNKITALRNQL